MFHKQFPFLINSSSITKYTRHIFFSFQCLKLLHKIMYSISHSSTSSGSIACFHLLLEVKYVNIHAYLELEGSKNFVTDMHINVLKNEQHTSYLYIWNYILISLVWLSLKAGHLKFRLFISEQLCLSRGFCFKHFSRLCNTLFKTAETHQKFPKTFTVLVGDSLEHWVRFELLSLYSVLSSSVSLFHVH